MGLFQLKPEDSAKECTSFPTWCQSYIIQTKLPIKENETKIAEISRIFEEIPVILDGLGKPPDLRIVMPAIWSIKHQSGRRSLAEIRSIRSIFLNDCLVFFRRQNSLEIMCKKKQISAKKITRTKPYFGRAHLRWAFDLCICRSGSYLNVVICLWARSRALWASLRQQGPPSDVISDSCCWR